VAPVVVHLPPINDIVNEVTAQKYTTFVHLDCLSFFWQFSLKPGISRDLTTFTSPLTGAKYRYTRCPFGLINSGAFAQLALLHTLGQLIESRAIYLHCDDLIVGGRTVTEILGILRQLFTELRDAGLTLGIRKSKFLYDYCEFLSHRITSEGVQCIPKYSTQTIKDFASPKSAKSVARWLAFANFYRRSIYGFAKRTAVIRNLLRKDACFVWSDECEKAFRDINNELITPPILRTLDRTKRVYIVCDGSRQGTGYSIYQLYGKTPMPILFGGQALNETQSKWPTHEIKAFSLLQALNTHYAVLAGTEITVLTDNATLNHWNNLQFQSMRTKRWATIFSQFNLNMVQIKSHKNPVDAISRMFDELTAEQRAKFTPAKSDEVDDFVLRVTEPPATPPPPDTTVGTGTANCTKIIDVSAPSALAISDAPISPSPKRHLHTKSVCSNTAVNAVITRSMHKANAPAQIAIKLQDTNNQPNASNSTSGDKTAITPSTVSNSASDIDAHAGSAVSTNDVELPYNNAPLDSEPDNNSALTDTADENQIDEMQLQPALEITIQDYLADDEFGPMMRFKLNGELSGDDKTDRKTLLIASDFLLIQNQLYRITDVRNKRLQRVRPHLTRLCIPKRFQLELVDKVHASLAHAAYEKLCSALRQRYYFASLNELAYQVPKCCLTCNEAKLDTTPRPLLFPHSHSGKWNQMWSIDHMALPRATRAGHRFILILVEQSTRWTELALCYTTSSRETASILCVI